MNATELVWPLTHLVTALVFLLLGWRLGRETVGRPMFAYPPGLPPDAEGCDEDDPWAEAARGRDGPVAGVDRNETEDWP